MCLLCSPVLTPHIIGGLWFPGEVTLNWSILHCPCGKASFLAMIVATDVATEKNVWMDKDLTKLRFKYTVN